jgi:citrate lyase subunit beta/citryl-CoA lyase
MTSTPPRAPLDVGSAISSARSFLFVPGDRPDRVGKALGSGADAVIVDLEDAVRAENRQYARSVIRTIPELAPTQSLLLVRVNAFRSADFADDVEAAIGAGVDGIVVPKFVPGRQASKMDDALSSIEGASNRSAPIPLIGLIESAAGLLGLSAPVAFPPRVLRLALGAADLHADLRISYSAAGIHTDLAMATLVLASAAAGLAEPLDSPYFSPDDREGLVAAVRRARERGFGGSLCIHPRQVAIVNAEFGISDTERAWAEQVLSAWSAPSNRGKGAIRVGDELVDEAMVRRARQIVDSDAEPTG